MVQDDKAKEPANVNIATNRAVDAPYISAGSMTVQGSGNEFILTFMRPVPIQSSATGVMNTGVLLNQPVAILALSPQTAKDVALALSDAVAKHEKEYGEITTPYTRRLAASAGRSKGH